MLAGIVPVRPDRKRVLFYQAFYVWRGFPVVEAQEIMAGLVCSGIVYLERMFSAPAQDRRMPCNNGTEVIQEEPCPHFHLNISPVFGMEVQRPDHVL